MQPLKKQKRCAFLSTDNLEDFFVYDHLTFEPLNELGWHTEEVSWRDEACQWDEYDVVVVRSTWDYQQAPQAFLACLNKIESSTAELDNSLALINWNIDKAYLKDLEEKGVTIVPTLWFEQFDLARIKEAYAQFSSDILIIKPTISANADDTFKLTLEELVSQQNKLANLFSDRHFMVQPFIAEIVDEGEYSLFYFNGHYSHTILKVPKKDDFRVQEEHGGKLFTIEPDQALKDKALVALKALPELPLYARLDFVRTAKGFAVMEIELIEPSLYFNMDPHSPRRFAEALTERYS